MKQIGVVAFIASADRFSMVAMPLYFFETDDGTHRTAGDGLELLGPQEVRQVVLASLPDMARDEMPNGDRSVIKVTAVDENGAVVYSASLTLVGQWGAEFRPKAAS